MGVSNLALAVSATAFASCHTWSLRGQSLSAAAALFAVVVKPSPAGAPCPVGVANPAALDPLGRCMVNACLLLVPVCFLRGLARATPSLVQRGAAALPCHLHCLAAPCHSLAGSWHSLIAGPPPLFVGPVAGTLSGAPPTVLAWLGGSPSDQPPSPRSSTVVHTCPPGGSVSSPAVVTHSAELPCGTLLQRTQCRSSSSLAPVAQSQAVTSVVMAGQDKLQPASKEPPTLILPITGLLGIPGALVLRIRLGKYVGRTQLCQSRAQPSPMGWAGVRRGNLQEVHSWGVPFPRMLQVQPCLYVVQVPWASRQGLLHVAAPSKEACTI